MALRPLNKELEKVAREELNEAPTRLKESLCVLKDWIKKQPHLKARTDDQWLVTFLRGCKYRLERTKEKIDLYYSLRSSAPDLFCIKYTDPKVMEILDTGVGLVLPKTASPSDPRYVLIRPGSYDAEKYNVMEIMAVGAIQQQICYMEDDNMSVSGSINILDFKGTKLSHFTQLTPLNIRKLVTINQEAAPTRMKAVHFLNTPPFFEPFFNITKALCTEKNKKRLHVHNSNYEEFYKSVSKDILPIEYGGSEYTVQELVDYWKMKFQQYNVWLKEDLQYGTDESKRLGKPSTAAIMFGVEGSFRRLELD